MSTFIDIIMNDDGKIEYQCCLCFRRFNDCEKHIKSYTHINKFNKIYNQCLNENKQINDIINEVKSNFYGF
jgi:hypothetical protein